MLSPNDDGSDLMEDEQNFLVDHAIRKRSGNGRTSRIRGWRKLDVNEAERVRSTEKEAKSTSQNVELSETNPPLSLLTAHAGGVTVGEGYGLNGLILMGGSASTASALTLRYQLCPPVWISRQELLLLDKSSCTQFDTGSRSTSRQERKRPG
ncbi:hypothetical protein DMENIID0001_131780 [Sergentomyia squamirostris]